MDILVPLATFALLGGFVVVLATARMRPEERDWMLRLLLIALALRLAAATMFALFPSTRIFHDDAEGYEAVGVALARHWHGEGPPPLLLELYEQNYGYYYLSGVTYYLFGPFRPVASYFNGVVGTLTVLLVYLLARRFFHVVVARRAALLTTFVPSMVLWSSLAIKDPITTFLIVVCLLSCVRLKERISVGALVGTVLPIMGVQPIRFYLIYILGAAVLLSLFLERGARAVSGLSKQLTVAGALIALLVVAGLSGRAEQGIQFFSFERLSNFREGMASTAQSGFANDVDISTPGRALAFLPVGLTMLLLAPFPWQFTSLRSSFTLPEMIVWWLLLPSLWRGLRFALRERFSQVSPVLLFAAILSVVYSFTHGNIGSAFRQRAQIFVFLFIFASLGQYLKVCRKSHIDERELLNDVAAPPPEAAPVDSTTATPAKRAA